MTGTSTPTATVPRSMRSGSGRLREIAALSHVLGPHRRDAMVGIGAAVAATVVILVTPYLSKVLVDDGIGPGSKGVVVGVALASASLVAASWALQRVQTRGLYETGNAMVVTLQSRLFSHVRGLGPSYHDEHPVGETLSRLTNDVIAAKQLVTSGLPTLVQNAVSFVGATAIMFVLDPPMASITLLVVPVLVGMTWAYRRVAAPRFLTFRDTVAGVTSAARDSLGVLDVIQSMNQTGRAAAEFADATLESRDAEYRTIRANAVYYPATTLLAATAQGLLVCFGGIQVVRGNSEIGTMVAFFGYLSLFLQPLVSFSDLFRSYQSGIAAIDKIFAVLAAPESAGSGRRDRLDDGPGTLVMRGVELPVAGRRSGVTLDLDVPGGSAIAVVGEEGSGHALVGRLLAGLLVPDGGTVTLDGLAIDGIASDVLHEHVGYVGPDATVFDGSVRDNLLLGVGEMADDDLVHALTGLFGDSEALSALVAGLDTPVGRSGRKLPAGLRNRILIVRAMLKEPRVLILDGVTDSVDARSVQRFAETRARRPPQTLVAISNQPLIARHADRVVVLAGGTVVEDGTHAELLRADGEYARLRRSWELGSVA